MQPAIVKWTVDLLAPGAIITTQLSKYYTTWRTFHSRRILWPVMDMKEREVLDMQEDGGKALVDFAHIRIASIMDNWDGMTDGPLDRKLTFERLDNVFDLAHVHGIALSVAPPYKLNKTHASWVGIYGVDDEKVEFIGQCSVRQIAKNMAPVREWE
jgi:hypothetical protein